MHPRQTVREAVKTAIDGLVVNGCTLSAFTNRVMELDEDTLPAAVILTENEVSQFSSKNGDMERTIDISIVVMLDGESETIDDDLDAWAEAIEPLANAITEARNMELTSTSMDIEPAEEGSKWMAFLALEYQATVFTNY